MHAMWSCIQAHFGLSSHFSCKRSCRGREFKLFDDSGREYDHGELLRRDLLFDGTVRYTSGPSSHMRMGRCHCCMGYHINSAQLSEPLDEMADSPDGRLDTWTTQNEDIQREYNFRAMYKWTPLFRDGPQRQSDAFPGLGTLCRLSHVDGNVVYRCYLSETTVDLCGLSSILHRPVNMRTVLFHDWAVRATQSQSIDAHSCTYDNTCNGAISNFLRQCLLDGEIYE